MGLHECAWVDLVADVISTPATGWPAEDVTRLLVETFSAPGGSFYQPRPDGLVQVQWPAALFASHQAEIRRWSAEDAPREHPLLRYYLGTGDRSPMQVLDVPDRFAGRRVRERWRTWCRSFHDADVSSQLALPVGSGPAPSTTFLVGRSERFTEQEVAYAHRLHRLLSGLDRHLSAYARWEERAGPVGVDVAGSVRLTPRELAVLQLLSSGRTARAIAGRLAVSERTVQKHLERVYGKLGVADRLTAVLRAQRLGLLGGPDT